MHAFLLLNMMSLRNEDRELQIKLTKLQIEHEYIASLFIGMLALEITVLLALETIFFSLYGNLEASLVRTYIVIGIFAMIPAVYLTLRYFSAKAGKLDEQMEELRKQYVWYPRVRVFIPMYKLLEFTKCKNWLTSQSFFHIFW